MTDLIYTRDNILGRGPVATVAVYTRSDWSNPWILQPQLLCHSLEHTVHGSIGKAQLKYRYGFISQTLGSQTTSQGYVKIDPPEFLNHWIKIEYTPGRVTSADPTLLTNTRDGQIVLNTTSAQLERLNGSGGPGWTPAPDLQQTYTWYGVIVSMDDGFMGADNAPTGDRMMMAQSLEYVMAKMQIFESKVQDRADVTTPLDVPRGIAFNGGRQDGRSSVNNVIENRGPTTTTTITPPPAYDGTVLADRQIFQFARSLKFDDNLGDPDDNTHSGLRWKVAEMVDYLLYWYPPTDTNAPPWLMAPASLDMDNFLYNFDFIDIETDGRTLLDVLNQVFDRRRGFTWWIEVFEDIAGDEIRIRVDSYARDPLTLTSGDQLPANARQYWVDWTSTQDGRSNQRLIRDSVQSYSEVVVTGAPFGSVFTLTVDPNQLKEDWTSADKLKYDTAHSGDGAYTSLDLSQRESINDQFRQGEDIKHVYSRYKLSETWTEENSIAEPVFPDWSAYDDQPTPGIATNLAGLWIEGRRFNNFILLKERWDYTVQPPVDNNPGETIADYLRPIVVAESVKDASLTTVYVHLDRSYAGGLQDELLGNGEGLDVSCAITPIAEQPGLNIMPALPHMIGPTGQSWDDPSASSTSAISAKTKSQIDPSTIQATVYMTHDKRVEQSAGVPGTIHNTDSTLYIRLGERAHYDVLCPQTVVGISADRQSLLKSPNDYIILRDDRSLLQDIADTAASWYSRDRSSIEVSHDQIIGDYLPGSLIQSIDLESRPDGLIGHAGFGLIGHDGFGLIDHGDPPLDVNSIITFVRHDFLNRTTSVRTQFTELDFGQLVG